jgi:hypothetical protein
MSNWSLPALLDALHQSVEGELRRARSTLGHPTEKGDASESVWIDVLNAHLPRRYEARKAHVVDSRGAFSEQIDVVIHDRQYSPLVFRLKDSYIVPVESVYAAFEAKQDLTGEHVAYAQKKIASVRRLHRTSLPVPTIDGTKPAKDPPWILGGIVTLGSTFSPPLGDTLTRYLEVDRDLGRLDLGCVADAGMFVYGDAGAYEFQSGARAATRYLFELIARLQQMGTAPMIDVRAYALHLSL